MDRAAWVTDVCALTEEQLCVVSAERGSTVDTQQDITTQKPSLQT